MKTKIKCAWCGGLFEPTKNDRPKQHNNGATLCLGSGQVRVVHAAQRKANAK